jgi:lysozyme
MKLLKRFLPVALGIILVLAQFGPAFADTTYVVQPGDTLFKIAQRFNVNPAALISANNLANPNLIYVGQRLIIPGSGGASGPVATQPPASTGTAGSTYTVQPGDTLYKIMLKFNVTASAVIAANGLTNPNLLFIGQRLIIPGVGGTVPVATVPVMTAQPTAPATSGSVYIVQAGDTLYRIAAKLNVDAAALIAANKLTNPNLIYVGQQLILPGGVAPTAVPPTAVPATAVPATAVPATAVPTAQAPTATPVSSGYNSRGIHGDSFSVENTSVNVNDNVWFNFQVTNTSAQDVYYTALAGHTDSGFTAWSWTNQKLTRGQTLKWRDHINFNSAGTYNVYLGICYASDTNACKSQAWDRLSASVAVTVH